MKQTDLPVGYCSHSINRKMSMTLMTGMAMENKEIDGLRDISKVEMKRIAVRLKGEE